MSVTLRVGLLVFLRLGFRTYDHIALYLYFLFLLIYFRFPILQSRQGDFYASLMSVIYCVTTAVTNLCDMPLCQQQYCQIVNAVVVHITVVIKNLVVNATVSVPEDPRGQRLRVGLTIRNGKGCGKSKTMLLIAVIITTSPPSLAEAGRITTENDANLASYSCNGIIIHSKQDLCAISDIISTAATRRSLGQLTP